MATEPVLFGGYLRWVAGNGAELWAQADQDGNLVGLDPHFTGKAVMRVGLAARVVRPRESMLDGAFYSWANPSSTDPESGDYPFVFDTPDYDLYRAVALTTVLDVQLSAFAHELEAFADEEAYSTSRQGATMATESFIPSGLFNPGGDDIDPPQADAILSGHVQDTALLTNPATGAVFYWARVRTYGREVDVVADPDVLKGTLVEGGVVWGWFWLSGRLLLNRPSSTDITPLQ